MGIARTASKVVFSATDFLTASPSGPRALIYHQVGAGLGRQMEVNPNDFRRQMDWLATNKTVVHLEEAVRRWNEPGADELVVLTFDDGYVDTATRAFPVLSELGLPFTLYIATDSIERSVSLGPSPAADPLTWSDIEKMTESGLVTVGAHTHTHPDLRGMSEDQIEEEIKLSNELIRQRLNVDPTHFAYPYGYWSADAERVVSREYLTAALGGSPRPAKSPSPHRLHRYPVQLSDGFSFFRRRVSGGFGMEERLRRRLKGYRGP